MDVSGFEPTQERLEAILRGLPEMVMVLDIDGHIRYLNRAELGYDPNDFVGRQAHELLPGSSRDVFDQAVEALLDTGDPQEYDVQVSLPDGFEGWYRTRMTALGESAEVTHLLLVSINVTEMKMAEAEADRLRTLLPICSWCDRIQDEAGQWSTMEDYLATETATAVSHGICPDCLESQLGESEEGEGRNGSAA